MTQMGGQQQIVDANGLATDLTYDARGRIATRDVGGELTTYAYDPAGQLYSVTSPDGSSLTYGYDAAHRLAQIQDNLGNRIVYTLDAMGNRTVEHVDSSQLLARLRGREYNALNRLAKDIGGTNRAGQITQYGYDLQGNATAITDPLGHLSTGIYDALNRLVQVTAPAAVGPVPGASTRYAYDGLDQLVQVTDARALATSYTIDGVGNLTRLASPDIGIVSSAFDAAGNLTMQIDTRGVTGTFTYDALNRLSLATYTPPSGSAIAPASLTFTYAQAAFATGKLSGITDPAAVSPTLTIVMAGSQAIHGPSPACLMSRSTTTRLPAGSPASRTRPGVPRTTRSMGSAAFSRSTRALAASRNRS